MCLLSVKACVIFKCLKLKNIIVESYPLINALFMRVIKKKVKQTKLKRLPVFEPLKGK
jgi:hypothetical protein